MKILVFVGIFTAVNCQSGDEWGNCTICDYEKPTIEDGYVHYKIKTQGYS